MRHVLSALVHNLTNTFGSEDRAVDATTRAYLHRDRLPELERQLTTAYYYDNVDFDPARVEAAYRRVLDAVPSQFVATNNLALLYLTQGRPAEAEALVAKEAQAADHVTNVQTQYLAALA